MFYLNTSAVCFMSLKCESESRLVVSDSLRPHGLYSLWSSLGQNTGVGSLPFSRESSQPKDRTQVSCITGRFFTSWATRDIFKNLPLILLSWEGYCSWMAFENVWDKQRSHKDRRVLFGGQGKKCLLVLWIIPQNQASSSQKTSGMPLRTLGWVQMFFFQDLILPAALATGSNPQCPPPHFLF